MAERLGTRHKLIRPYTPRHNGKMERSHREDQKRFYDAHSFYSLAVFTRQSNVHHIRTNNILMRPLRWLNPKEKLREFFTKTLQYVLQTYQKFSTKIDLNGNLADFMLYHLCSAPFLSMNMEKTSVVRLNLYNGRERLK